MNSKNFLKEKKQLILSAAFKEFTQKGFALTRMSDIAIHAGISKGSIYNYFENKESLFQELITEFVLPVVPQTFNTNKLEKEPKIYILELLTNISKEIVSGNPGLLLKLVLKEGDRFPKITEIYYNTIISVALTNIETIVKYLNEKNHLRNPDLQKFPQLLIAPILQGFIWENLFSQYKKIDFEKMLSLYLDIIFNEGNDDI